jgi:hypothetical protein
MSVSAQTMLDNIETAINAILTGGAVQNYSVNGRSLSHFSLAELYKLRNDFKIEINAAQRKRNYAGFKDPT